MKCYASALIINDVQSSDFGNYSCNFSDHGAKYPDYYDRYNRYDNVQNITLFDESSSEKQPLKVEYFENFYTKGIRSKMLMQCVVTGGQLYWFVMYEYNLVRCTYMSLLQQQLHNRFYHSNVDTISHGKY